METLHALKQNAEIILPENGLELKLAQAEKEQRKLIIKLGFDPTAPDLHLGHAVVLKKLKQFQDLGHTIIILVGSFTARIGDPTGKNKSRKPLNIEEVQANALTYINQLSKIINVDKAQVVYNSDWLENLSGTNIIELMSKVTVAQLLHRNDFNKRFNDNTPIAMHELVYPILQGFDSVNIKADIEMGGTDQLFNCTMGRQLQEEHGLDAQIVLCMPLLRGLDGKEKMSKSLNNIIGLTDEPNDMFGKTMSIPDSLLEEYIDLTTDFTAEEKSNLKQRLSEGENPMLAKKIIAKNIVTQYHSAQLAEQAETHFSKQFQNKTFNEKDFTPVYLTEFETIKQPVLADICHALKKGETKSAIRRLIEAGAVQVNGTKIINPYEPVILVTGMKIKIGKREFYKLV